MNSATSFIDRLETSPVQMTGWQPVLLIFRFSRRPKKGALKNACFSGFSRVGDFFQNITRLVSRVFSNTASANARFLREKRPFSEKLFTEGFFLFAESFAVVLPSEKRRWHRFSGSMPPKSVAMSRIFR
jgi:hypothetical protein